MKSLFQPYIDLVFPKTCVCCRSSLSDKERYICIWCQKKRFEYVHDDDRLILPSNIKFVFSMWQFDKGGYLQDLLHELKYNFLQDVGEELGYIAGRAFLEKTDADLLQYLDGANPVIVPVPLHKSKKRTRGYNQSRALARGFARAADWKVAEEGIVKRVKKTKTQTGLNTEQRSKNLKGAFEVVEPNAFQGCFPVIMDDVFTTGATTYELAQVITSNSQGAGIVTVARS